ncbi:MAG TPA: RIO1 family regulatory kinase/ATPase [Thermoplasmata archaeon]|nr:RIO1 family regulatory kinase/ATPase [Thermoplasmata archaeon]
MGRLEVPNQPYLDSSVAWRIRAGRVPFHEPGFEEVAEAIVASGIAERVERRIGSGKEADVYLCVDREQPLAVKFYRLYRTSHRGGGTVKPESTGQLASRELELLYYAWRGGAPVPEPGERFENMFAMEYLGSADGPAPTLNRAPLRRPGPFLEATLAGIDALLRAGIVHSDLSPFNILVHRDAPWFIDLAAGVRVDRLGTSPWQRLSEASRSLEHGLRTLERHFRKYGLRIDVDRRLHEWVDRIDRFGVLR